MLLSFESVLDLRTWRLVFTVEVVVVLLLVLVSVHPCCCVVRSLGELIRIGGRWRDQGSVGLSG